MIDEDSFSYSSHNKVVNNLRIWISSVEFGGKSIAANAVSTSAVIIIGTKSGNVLYNENNTCRSLKWRLFTYYVR